MALAAIHDIDALNGFVHLDDSLGKVDVLPSEGTNLTNTHPGRETYQNAQVAEGKVFSHMAKQPLLVGDGKHLDLLFLQGCWELDVPFFVWEEMEFHAVAVHHLENDEQVLHGLAAQCLEFRDDELLHLFLNNP